MSSPIVTAITDVVSALTYRNRYQAAYAARVLLQHADGSVDVRADSPDLTVPHAIPIRYDSPGWSATVPAGARCNVKFSDGDPRKPYACDFEHGTITQLVFDGGTHDVARTDDTVACGTVAVSALGAILTIVYTPPTGSSTTIPITITGAGVGVSVTPVTFSITGKITSGNTKLKA